MENQGIFIRKYNHKEENDLLFPVNEKEIWRYAGYRGVPKEDQAELLEELQKVYKDLEDAFSFAVCYRRFPITWENGMPVLPFPSQSKGLATFLRGSDEVVMFAATIGPEIDRHILKNERFYPTKALLMQAYGAERIEALCDGFCEELREEFEDIGLSITNRFSPGYGDLPLETQKDFFSLLDISHLLGISLGDSLLMRPSKSVTAIFGIKKQEEGAEPSGCKRTRVSRMEDMKDLESFFSKSDKCLHCSNEECEYR